MKLLASQKRIAKYVWARKADWFSKAFFQTARRIVYRHFNFWEKVSEREFRDNLKVVEQRPWNIHVELTNLCNANCIFCAYQYQTRPYSTMTQEIFTRVLDEYCAIGGGNFHFGCVVGDPLVDREFIMRIHEARFRKQIRFISTITNGIGIKIDEIEQLLTSGINQITVSTGPWRKQDYEAIFRTRSYDRMRLNVSELLKINQKLGGRVNIVLSFRSNLSMNDTLALPDYQQIANLPHVVQFNTDYDSWTGKIKQESLLAGMVVRPPNKPHKEPCQWFYHGPVVFPNGDVGVCGCRDYNADSDLILGNIQRNSLIELWQSDKMASLRKGFYRGQFPSICSECDNYTNLDVYRTKPGSQRVKFIKAVWPSSQTD